MITSPTDIPSSVLWLDASDLASITSAGGFVSQWNDKSAVGTNHFTQGTGGQQPQTGAASQNGLNVLTFDGSNDHLLGPAVLAGNAMFTYTFTKDIPKKATTWDIRISRDDVQPQGR